jgi:hypothetical protein
MWPNVPSHNRPPDPVQRANRSYILSTALLLVLAVLFPGALVAYVLIARVLG